MGHLYHGELLVITRGYTFWWAQQKHGFSKGSSFLLNSSDLVKIESKRCWWKCHVWIPKPDFSFNLPFLGLAYRFLMNFPLQKPRHSIQVVDAHGKAQPKKRLVRQRDWKIRCGLKPVKSRYVWGMNIHKSSINRSFASSGLNTTEHILGLRRVLSDQKKRHISWEYLFFIHIF